MGTYPGVGACPGHYDSNKHPDFPQQECINQNLKKEVGDPHKNSPMQQSMDGDGNMLGIQESDLDNKLSEQVTEDKIHSSRSSQISDRSNLEQSNLEAKGDERPNADTHKLLPVQ
jgi:hypothetical protein